MNRHFVGITALLIVANCRGEQAFRARSPGGGGGTMTGVGGIGGTIVTGSAGTGGDAGAAATGTGGSVAGASGATGAGGTAGTTATAGTGGSIAGTSGTAGTAGAAGRGGTGGAAGTAGTGGTAGTAGAGGTAGTAGRGGIGGTAGTGGTADATGRGGASGSGGGTAGTGGAAGSGYVCVGNTDGGAGPFTCPATICGSLDATDAMQIGREDRLGPIAACGAGSTWKGSNADGTNPHVFDVYHFVNPATTSACFTLTLNYDAMGGTVQGYLSAYTSFDPLNISSNFLGDVGGVLNPNPTTMQMQTMAITVPPASTIDIVVVAIVPATGIGSYALNCTSQ